MLFVLVSQEKKRGLKMLDINLAQPMMNVIFLVIWLEYICSYIQDDIEQGTSANDC